MSNKQIDIILRYMRTSLYSLFFMLFCLGIYFLYLTTQSFIHLNANSLESSQIVSNSVFANERENLGKIVYDYSYWNQAAEALSGNADSPYFEENLDGNYLLDTFDINQVIVYNADGEVLIRFANGQQILTETSLYSQPDFKALVKKATKVNYKSPTPVTSFINIAGQLHFIAASAIVPSLESDTVSLGKLYGVLVMTRPVDDPLLYKWQSQFHLYNLSVQPKGSPLKDDFTALKVMNPLGEHIADIVWKPDLPGKRYLGEIMPMTSLIIVFLATVSVVFFLHFNRYIRLTLFAAKELENNRDELQKLAHYDTVTALPNRLLGMDRLEQAIKASSRYNTLTAVLFIDLDGFKNVNDTFGHDIGDDLLHNVAQLLTSCVREGVDTVSRLGGDEFTIILANLQNKTDARLVAEKILQLLQKKISIRGSDIMISASIGISLSRMNTITAEEMIKQADMAMYKAKLSGKNQYFFYDET
ncbi:diguanylate cyclase domain-containing protein [Methylophaga sp.]|uniref:sensor domain-containing diguanylate cyclase n=1 Tax=Methylophaga sp. TaxID=2024840 RepID=UPI002722AC0F|nr:diguanylate cyclase [Methylophaga sp.]MDO8827593.1 diguanylate cyclase [Methylophaga sp.]